MRGQGLRIVGGRERRCVRGRDVRGLVGRLWGQLGMRGPMLSLCPVKAGRASAIKVTRRNNGCSVDVRVKYNDLDMSKDIVSGGSIKESIRAHRTRSARSRPP